MAALVRGGRIRGDKKNGGSGGVGASSSVGTKSSGCSGSGMYTEVLYVYLPDPPKSMGSCDALRKCILDGPYQPTIVTIPVVPATKNSPEFPKRTAVETVSTMSPENKRPLMKRGKLSKGYNKVNEMIRNNLTIDKMQVNVQFLQQLQPEWSTFVTIVKQQHKLDEVSYHKFFDILKQYQKEVNEFRAERIAKNANPLALVATAQPHQDPYYQTSKSHKSYAPTSKSSLPTKSHATIRHKGKEIAKPITPLYESPFDEDSDLE
ncbi:hypothetical protein Tco_0266822 [Tanacetum coccineum]